MKIALLADTHIGARNDSPVMNEHFIRFHTDLFIPYLLEQGIDTVIHLGDLFDRRKYVNFNTLYQWRHRVFDVLRSHQITLHVICGNHDVYFKNTNEVNALRELIAFRYDNIKVYSKAPTEITLDGYEILLVPWVTDDNLSDVNNSLNKSNASLCIGHFEIKGFEVYAGHVNEDRGFDAKAFHRFTNIFSGHYHHKSSDGEIHYLGAPYEMVWSDADDPRGFHVFDTETEELTFIRNPERIFRKVHYSDDGKTLEEVLSKDFTPYKDCYVKVIVKDKTNPYHFDQYMQALADAGPVDVSVIEGDVLDTYLDEGDGVDETKDTRSILLEHIDGLEMDTGKKELKDLISNLYLEALNMDVGKGDE